MIIFIIIIIVFFTLSDLTQQICSYYSILIFNHVLQLYVTIEYYNYYALNCYVEKLK